MTKWQEGLEGSGWNALCWNNHDQPRMLSRLGDEGEWRCASAKMLACCLHMMKGTPFIYQGEELGMTNMRFTGPEQLRDNESRNAYYYYAGDSAGGGSISHRDMLRYISLKSRDNARTPMQWSGAPGAGFSEGTPWMDINPNYVRINAEEQLGREDSVLGFYKRLIRLRRSFEVIVYGRFVPYDLENPDTFSYLRLLGGQTLFVCCNFTARELEGRRPAGFDGPGARMLLSNYENSGYMADGRMAPFEAVVLLKDEKEYRRKHDGCAYS
jgi:oligo-1,6-glucosidase